MVLKLRKTIEELGGTFESDVISDGTQTIKHVPDVKHAFESDVISDGTQTDVKHTIPTPRLRVM